MSTNIKRGLAHAEKSKFSILCPEIPYDSPRNVVGFFSSNVLLKPKKLEKPVWALRVLKTPEKNLPHTFS